jgi:hypothetical protein
MRRLEPTLITELAETVALSVCSRLTTHGRVLLPQPGVQGSNRVIHQASRAPQVQCH